MQLIRLAEVCWLFLSRWLFCTHAGSVGSQSVAIGDGRFKTCSIVICQDAGEWMDGHADRDDLVVFGCMAVLIVDSCETKVLREHDYQDGWTRSERRIHPVTMSNYLGTHQSWTRAITASLERPPASSLL